MSATKGMRRIRRIMILEFMTRQPSNVRDRSTENADTAQLRCDRISVRCIYLAGHQTKMKPAAWKEPVASSVGSSHPLPVFGNDAQAAPRFAFATVNLFTGTLRPR